MRVLFINKANEDILNEITNFSSTNNNNYNNNDKNDIDNDKFNFNSIDNISKCKKLGKFLKDNDFDLKSIFSSNDPVCLKTAEIISSNFKEDIEMFVNLELRDYNQALNLPLELKKEFNNTLSKFKFCDMNSIENIDKYKNIEKKNEWYNKLS
jgi:hypothetical protein